MFCPVVFIHFFFFFFFHFRFQSCCVPSENTLSERDLFQASLWGTPRMESSLLCSTSSPRPLIVSQSWSPRLRPGLSKRTIVRAASSANEVAAPKPDPFATKEVYSDKDPLSRVMLYYFSSVMSKQLGSEFLVFSLVLKADRLLPPKLSG
jgi:hypothetical protein